MARRKTPFEESATYEVYLTYKQHVMNTDTIPNPHSFWEKILKPKLGYQMGWGSFQYHIMQLQIRGLLTIDETTKAVSFPELDVVEKG